MSDYLKYADDEDRKALASPAPQGGPEVEVSVSDNTGVLTDVVQGLVRSVPDAAQEAAHGLIDLSEWALDKSGVGDLATKVTGRTTAEAADNLRRMTTFASPKEQKTWAGATVRNVSKFVLGFLGVSSLKAAKVASAAAKGSVAGTIGVSAAKGAVADFLVSNPYDARLSDLIESVPALQNPVTEYLASDPRDGRAEGRLKAALEGIVPGVILDAAVTAFRGFRAAKVGDEKVAEQAAEEVRVLLGGNPAKRPSRVESPAILQKPEETGNSIVVDATGKKVQIDEREMLRREGRTRLQDESKLLKETAEESPAPEGTLRSAMDIAIERASLAIKEDLDRIAKAMDERGAEQAARLEQALTEAPDKPARIVPEMSDAERAAIEAERESARKELKTLRLQLEQTPRWFREQTGGVNAQLLAQIATSAATGVVAGATGETPEERITNALVGAGMGLLLSRRIAKVWMTKGGAEAAQKASEAATEGAKKAAPNAVTVPSTAPKVRPLSPETAKVFQERLIARAKGQVDDPDPLAGVLNYAKMDSAAAVKNTLHDLAEIADTTISGSHPHLQGTYRSLQETKELAEILGEDYHVVRGNLARMAKFADMTDGYVVAGKTWVQSLSRDVTDLAKKISSGVGTAADEVEMVRRADILADLLDHLSAVQTGAARATSAGRIRTFDAITPQTVAEALESAGGSDAIKTLAARIAIADGNAKAIKAAIEAGPLEKALQVHNFVWINGVLSGVKTHVVNAVSNLANTLIRPAERWLGGAMGRDPQQMRRAVYTYAAFRHVIGDSLEVASRALKQNASILDPGNSPLQNVVPLSAEYLQLDKNSVLGWGVDWLGKIVGVSGRLLNAGDEFFKQMNYRADIMAEAWAEGIDKGLTGDGLKEFVETKLRSSVDEMGRALNSEALAAAREATFTQPLAREAVFKYHGQTVAELVAHAGGHPLLRGTILPFVKVPMNIFRTFVDTGPIALLQKHFYSEIKAGGEAKAMALGKLGMGSMLWTIAAMMAAEGRITGSGPRDPDLQQKLRSTGWQPYSFVFENEDGTKSYVSFAKLDPLGQFFGLAADFMEITGKAEQGLVDNVAVAMTLALARNLSSKTYLRGIVDFASTLGSGYTADDAAKKWVQFRIASYVPSGFSLLNSDDELKNVRTILDAVKARIPGNDVEAKRDNFGEKILAPMGYPYTAINPFTITARKGDTVREELASLAASASEARFPLPPEWLGNKAAGIDLTQIKNAQGQSAYDRWLELHGTYKIGGRTLYESLADLFDSQAYKTARERMGDGSAVFRQSLAIDLIQRRMDMYRDMTKQQMLREFGLDTIERQLKIDERKVRVLGPGAATFRPLTR